MGLTRNQVYGLLYHRFESYIFRKIAKKNKIFFIIIFVLVYVVIRCEADNLFLCSICNFFFDFQAPLVKQSRFPSRKNKP